MNRATTVNDALLVAFLCEHFTAQEIMYLAQGIVADLPQDRHDLPPLTQLPLHEGICAFVHFLKRRGLLDDEFFRALCAARPRLKDKIENIWRYSDAPLGGREGAQRQIGGVNPSASTRLRVRLEADFESLPSETIQVLLDVVSIHSGIARVVIESVTSGSVNLIIRGKPRAIEHLHQVLSQMTELAGMPVISVEFVPFEARPPAPSFTLDRPPAVRAFHGRLHLILENFNLNTAERALCIEALTVTGSIVEAAQLLGVTRHALKRRIIKHRIEWSPHPVAKANKRETKKASARQERRRDSENVR